MNCWWVECSTTSYWAWGRDTESACDLYFRGWLESRQTLYVGMPCMLACPASCIIPKLWSGNGCRSYQADGFQAAPEFEEHSQLLILASVSLKQGLDVAESWESKGFVVERGYRRLDLGKEDWTVCRRSHWRPTGVNVNKQMCEQMTWERICLYSSTPVWYCELRKILDAILEIRIAGKPNWLKKFYFFCENTSLTSQTLVGMN